MEIKKQYYHYTTVDAMASILKNGQLRLTRSEFLNDPADCKILARILESYLENLKTDTLLKKFFPETDVQNRVRPIYDRAPLIDYINFLQRHIHLYVLSLTKNRDQLSMWNYYGSGGIELVVNTDHLIEKLRSSLRGKKQFLTYAPVQYISERSRIEDIEVTPIKDFPLDRYYRKDIFEKHYEHYRASKKYRHKKLYETKQLKVFIDEYIEGYFKSLESLSRERKKGGEIIEPPISVKCSPEGIFEVNRSPEEIFATVYRNTNALCDDWFLYKKDMALYLLVLSALLKIDTYRHENEFRVVVFENTLKPRFDIQYGTQNLNGQKYIRPYWETIPQEKDSEKVSKKAEAPESDAGEGPETEEPPEEAKDPGLRFIKKVVLSPLARNLPIEDDLYRKAVEDFAKKAFAKSKIPRRLISAEWSNLRVRW